MKDAFQTRVLAVVLAVATVAAAVFAVLNLRQEMQFDVPTDGVWWMEAAGGLRAEQVPAGTPAERAGVRQGDILLAVNDRPTPRLAMRERELFRSGIWSHATYSIQRNSGYRPGSGTRLEIPVILEPLDRSSNDGFRLIALIYLSIGIYVLFRRWTAPKATHFYVFCLVSFVLYAFKYTGVLDSFDEAVYWANLAATALQPALFLHFAVSFSNSSTSSRRSRWARLLLVATFYVPGALLVGLQFVAIYYWTATEILRHRLDQIGVGYQALYYVIAAIVFWIRYKRAHFALERQQLKWLTRGTFVAVTPYTLFFAIPYMADVPTPGLLTKVAGLSLVVLPLTFSWAIVRYRLMDTDLIFKRGVTYTLATASLVGLYFAVLAVTAETVRSRLPSLRLWGLVAAVTITGLVFDPLKRAIQARVDRLFDQKRFDYRETLVEFGRGLNSQTDLRTLVDAIVERLPQTLLVTRVAVFLSDDSAVSRSAFHLAASHGLADLSAAELPNLDLRFLNFDEAQSTNHIFWENPRQVLRLPKSERASAARLDLNYYLPCRVASREGLGTRTVAVIGLGLTRLGDFLSSEDVELLESLASYIGIAIQNAQLYRRLELQIGEFERLKEFHENIVESINVGVFAVDLEDHIESWNRRMEILFGITRADALRKPLSAVLPADFLRKIETVRFEHGTHAFYKHRIELSDGELHIANIAVAPLVSKTAVPVGRIILIDDITDRVELEAQLTQSEKLSSIGLLAAGVAHEVNTPLAVISAYTQMLTKQMAGDARLTPVLEKITQQSFRASEIVNGLLNFSRTSGTERTDVDLNRLVRDTVNLIDHQLKTAKIFVDLDLDPALSAVQGNQGKIQQVLLNFLLNAKDAMHRAVNGRIAITTTNRASTAVIRIQDTGSGISQEHLHRIYDPFFTTKTAPREGEHKGTGLGLAVSYGIMQEHGGKIHVESALGIGTTFELEFPAFAPVFPEAASTAGERTILHA